MEKTIAIIDYGAGNLHSIERALQHVGGCRTMISDEESLIEDADAVVFPGQGVASQCIPALHRSGIGEAVARAAVQKPFLGICMGLQVLMDQSEEGEGTAGLGVFRGSVKRMRPVGMKVPHMGWNVVRQRQEHPLWHGICDGSWFYFVHSYTVHPSTSEHIAATCVYGQEFCCALSDKKLFAIQAHPEKSGAVGLRLLKNFVQEVNARSGD